MESSNGEEKFFLKKNLDGLDTGYPTRLIEHCGYRSSTNKFFYAAMGIKSVTLLEHMLILTNYVNT